MSSSILEICERLSEIKDQFEETEEIVEAISARENAEDLFVAISMAIAYLEGAITLDETGESYLQTSIREIERILEKIEGGDD
jgi:hypothetical protein